MSDVQIRMLERALDERLQGVNSRRKWYRKRYYVSQMSTIVISGIITIAAGINMPFIDDQMTSNAILILGAISTVVAAWGAIFSPQKFWHLNTETRNQLLALKAEFEFFKMSDDFDSKKDEITMRTFEKLQAILRNHNENWSSNRKDEAENS